MRTALVALLVVAAPCLVLVSWEGVARGAPAIALRKLPVTIAVILRLARVLLQLLDQIRLVLLILRTRPLLHEELLSLMLFKIQINKLLFLRQLTELLHVLLLLRVVVLRCLQTLLVMFDFLLLLE